MICPRCDGKGHVLVNDNWLKHCDTCHGSGKIADSAMPWFMVFVLPLMVLWTWVSDLLTWVSDLFRKGKP